MALVLFAAIHLAAGMLIGVRYRVAALLLAFVVVVLEAIVGVRFIVGFSWWLLALVGIAAVQLGYVAAGAWLSYRGLRRPDGAVSLKQKLDRVSGG